MTGQFVPVRVNAEKEGVALAKKYHVSGFPTILFIDGGGAVEATIGGYMEPIPFGAELSKIETTHKQLPIILARYKTNPGDYMNTARLAGMYAGKGDLVSGARLLSQAEAKGKRGQWMVTADYALADGYQTANQFAPAIALFKRGLINATTPRDKAHGDISIAVCYLSQRNFAAATPFLKQTVAIPGAPADLKAQAQQMLDSLAKMKH